MNIAIRCSDLPRLARCPASHVTSQGQPRASSEASVTGTAFHEVFATAQDRGLHAAHESLAEVARKHRVEEDLLREWLQHIPLFDGVAREVEAGFARSLTPEVTLRGRADLVLLDPMEVVDLKTGDPDYQSEDDWLQLAGYAWGLLADRAQSAVLSLWYVRLADAGWAHREVGIPEVGEELAGIATRVAAQHAREPEHREYRVGDHCTFCPGRAVCPARTSALREFAAIVETGALPPITPEVAPALLERARALDKLTAAVKDAVKDLVRECGGEIPAGDGRVLRLVTSQRKEYVVRAGEVESLRVVKA